MTLLLTAMAAAGLVFEMGVPGWLLGATSPAHAAQWRRQPWAYAASLDDVAVRFQQQDADPHDGYVCVCVGVLASHAFQPSTRRSPTPCRAS